MNSRNTILAALLLILNACVNAQDLNVVQLNNVEAAFNSINPKPKVCNFKSKYKAPAGGHLQGIQAYNETNKSFSGQIVITGSSDTYSYYVKARLDDKVDTLVKIAYSPYRHAGGCQVVGDNLFAGIEDNIAKNNAQVVMCRIKTPSTPVTIARRQGTYKRSTAGAVGAIALGENYLVATGDWDTRNIDFYKLSKTQSDSVGTFWFGDTGPPCSYQSINLLSDTANHIYLIGLGKEGNNNRADLFLIENYQLKLIATRLFKTNNGCCFRYGAGINCLTPEILQIYTCQRTLTARNTVNVFGGARE